MNGVPLEIKGLNWFGYQTDTGIFHGLWSQPPSYFLDTIFVNNGFNAVRIPLDLDLMLNDREHGYVTPEADEGYPSALMDMTSLETLDWFVLEFAQRGIIVLLDMHCLDTSGTDASPLFFNDQYTFNDTITGWIRMAQRYNNSWNVFASDVFNEPYAASWAAGLETDMDTFAVTAGNAIRSHADWLIFVEGASSSPVCDSIIDGDEVVCGYGDNLLGVADNPVVLADGSQNKVVYTPHTYGPSQQSRAEFENADFPNNMPDVWENHWGYIINTTSREAPAVILGEWGGTTDDDNGLWMDKLVSYLTNKSSVSNFFWSLNEDSDPVGIVTDWTVDPPTIDEAKLELLSKLTPNPTDILAVLADVVL